MYMTSDKHERELIEAAIRDAHEMRALAIADGLKAFAIWVKHEVIVLLNLVKHRKATADLTHSSPTA